MRVRVAPDGDIRGRQFDNDRFFRLPKSDRQAIASCWYSAQRNGCVMNGRHVAI